MKRTNFLKDGSYQLNNKLKSLFLLLFKAILLCVDTTLLCQWQEIDCTQVHSKVDGGTHVVHFPSLRNYRFMCPVVQFIQQFVFYIMAIFVVAHGRKLFLSLLPSHLAWQTFNFICNIILNLCYLFTKPKVFCSSTDKSFL